MMRIDAAVLWLSGRILHNWAGDFDALVQNLPEDEANWQTTVMQ